MVRNSIPNFKEASRHKMEGREFDSRWCHWNFSMTQFFGHAMPLQLTQPLPEMGTTNIFLEVKTAGDQLITFMCRLSRNLGASNSWKLHDLSRPVQRLLYLPNLKDQTSDCTHTVHNSNFRENSRHSNSKKCISQVHSVFSRARRVSTPSSNRTRPTAFQLTSLPSIAIFLLLLLRLRFSKWPPFSNCPITFFYTFLFSPYLSHVLFNTFSLIW
jgi:hypothetical protein